MEGLAYTVVSDFWNQGFATVMGDVRLEVGFGPLGFPKIA